MIDYGLVSVVMASYNMGKYLPIAIQSVLDQSYTNWEMNVIDDGSTDNTSMIMKEFLGESRINYHYQENLGQAKAKNNGILKSKGEYIAFLDADDLWKSDKLEKQLPFFKINKNLGVVYSDVMYIDEKGVKLPQQSNKTYYSGHITEQLFVDNFINFGSVVVKKKCFNDFGIFNESIPMSIDWDLWLRISTKFEFVCVDEPLFVYRQWSGQMSHNFEKRFKCIIDIMERFSKEHAGKLSSKTIKKAWAHTYCERAWKGRALEKDKKTAFKFLIKALKNDITFIPAWKEMIKLGLLSK